MLLDKRDPKISMSGLKLNVSCRNLIQHLIYSLSFLAISYIAGPAWHDPRGPPCCIWCSIIVGLGLSLPIVCPTMSKY